MSIKKGRGRPVEQPTPDQIRTARKAAKFTQTEAAELVHVKLRTWQGWEQDGPEGARMPLGLWELFLIKIGRRQAGR